MVWKHHLHKAFPFCISKLFYVNIFKLIHTGDETFIVAGEQAQETSESKLPQKLTERSSKLG